MLKNQKCIEQALASVMLGKVDRDVGGLLHEECLCTDKKENQIFLIFKEIQSGAVAKSYMWK